MPTSYVPVTPDDLSNYADVTRVCLSPDGGYVAAAVATPDVQSNRYLRSVRVGAVPGDQLETLDAGAPDRTRLPQWSADGRYLAVVVDGPNGCGIRVVEPRGGRVHVLLEDWPDAIEELSWSPDGDHLLFVIREPVDREYWTLPDDSRPPLHLTQLRYREDGIGWLVGRPRQAYLLAVRAAAEGALSADGEPTKLSRGGFDDAEFSWHPDGQTVYFVSQRHDGRDRTTTNDIFAQTIGGEPRRLTSTEFEFHWPRPSPDGSRLSASITDVAAYPVATHLALVNVGDGQVTNLSEGLDRDCDASSVVWSGPGTVLAVVLSEGRVGVRAFDAAEPGRVAEVLGGDRQVTAFDARAGRLVAVEASSTQPPIVVVGQWSAGDEANPPTTRWHDPNADIRAARTLGVPQHSRVETAPGVQVDSWLVRPDSREHPGSRPVVVWLQGGGGQYGYQWSHELQVLVSAGFAVLYLNARGSGGYGTAWMRTVSGVHSPNPGNGWGTDDVADVAAVVSAALEANPDLDASRVGVMGGSYGGLVTAMMLAKTDLFAAGWAERGPYNLYSDAGTMDEAPWFFEAYLGASHLDDAESYWQASPLRYVAGITAPLMIVHSELDYRCAIGQAEELFFALKVLGREVEFLRFPGECHGLTRTGSPVHRLQRLEHLLTWFGRLLDVTQSDNG